MLEMGPAAPGIGDDRVKPVRGKLVDLFAGQFPGQFPFAVMGMQ